MGLGSLQDYERSTTERHRTGRLWLAMPFVVLYTADVALTLSGQPSEYRGAVRAESDGWVGVTGVI